MQNSCVCTVVDAESTVTSAKLSVTSILMTQAVVQVTGIEVHISSSSEKEGYFSGNCMVLNGDVLMYFTVGLPSLHYEVPQNMGSVLVKETRAVALNFSGHKF